MIADFLSQRYSTPVIVENRPGASGGIGGEYVARSAPDGHTWLIAAAYPLATGPLLNGKMPYDPQRDLAPVSLVFSTDHVMTVNKTVKARDLNSFIAEAQAGRGPLRYGSPGIGTAHHLIGEMLQLRTGLDLVHIPYRGSAAAVTDQLAGTIELMFDQLQTSLPHIRSGSVRAVAVTGAKRNANLPDVPTIAEILPGFEAQSWNGIAVPAGTPAALVEKISADIGDALNDPASKAKLVPLGADYAASTPAEMGTMMRAEVERWAPVIRAANISMT
ncbi:Bug family tripartite tricarboxylate transporter substrate binding protein [Roseomonas xinghualingensis]|uniref:Bug family tripartite tricarboxylate transporter substrate binding protein n=1 Tax=Roseomonas xinghualingensis TaxID=2986475 RepID=UPI0021F19FDC|nr:tripartite tricarboxylate transporter substrate-binding protein [Roseomonas sp. SXEYE001]MCV4209610.1 tripartite tricarboxylate transporter substrate-binding protein [Roseomonas sp. SXEYE001]